jgi:hypothetical protein
MWIELRINTASVLRCMIVLHMFDIVKPVDVLQRARRNGSQMKPCSPGFKGVVFTRHMGAKTCLILCLSPSVYSVHSALRVLRVEE